MRTAGLDIRFGAGLQPKPQTVVPYRQCGYMGLHAAVRQ